jgi:hypothetical protein
MTYMWAKSAYVVFADVLVIPVLTANLLVLLDKVAILAHQLIEKLPLRQHGGEIR